MLQKEYKIEVNGQEQIIKMPEDIDEIEGLLAHLSEEQREMVVRCALEMVKKELTKG